MAEVVGEMTHKCRSYKKKVKTKGTSPGKVTWKPYPSPEEKGFGNGKFCYFISCPKTKLPLRDYVYEKKLEPHYETRSYNECAKCNQRGIRKACYRGISYIIFYTRYQGKLENFRNKYFITGLFPISAWRRVSNRVAYRSEEPIFLSIQDSKEIDDKLWRRWFGKALPTDNRGAHSLRYMAKFVTKDSSAMKDVISHFDSKIDLNKIDEYIEELKK